MKVENALYPDGARMMALMNDKSGEPVVMLNLLRFRCKAVYADGRETALTGIEAYQLYAGPMQTLVESQGGKFVFGGRVGGMVIGEVEQMWDICALVEYPSAAAFAKIAMSPEVREIGVHRAAGLEGQLLIRVAQRPL
ncbi:MAG TPA: DUF1330 domain-containing protein [Rhizomicrobium sp.]|nr:DUF1330 domain-containing protein [Rhizomicrobium sp.]